MSSTAVAGMYEYFASSPICKLSTSREKGAALCAVFCVLRIQYVGIALLLLLSTR